MISGFGGGSRGESNVVSHHLSGGGLPVPFNIPKVLHNLLFEEIGIEFDAKQNDMLETLRFSSHALNRMNEKYNPKVQELKNMLFKHPDNLELKREQEELQMDFFEANQHFKELVIVLSEILSREQYAVLLKYSNIPV